MKQYIQNVSITKPCHESWDNMADLADGKFCNSCQKSVVDFTGLSNDQILAHISNKTSLCGKFGEGQLLNLNQYLSTAQVTRFSFRKFGLAAAIIWLIPFVGAEAKGKISTYYTFNLRQYLNNGDTINRRKKNAPIICKSYTARDVKIDLILSSPDVTKVNLDESIQFSSTVGGLVVRRSSFFNRMIYAIERPIKSIFNH